MRLDRLLALYGYGSRSEVKELVRKGQVARPTGDGTPAPLKDPGEDVPFGTVLSVMGREFTAEEFEYYIIYKPAGCLTAKSDPKKPVVMSLLPSKRTDLAPVGRLDEDTEGLLLITNDGALTHALIGPKNHALKKYRAVLDRPLPEAAKALLEAPMDLGDFITKPGIFEKINDTTAFLTISEGKFHQVKRMFEKVGCTVTHLRREAFGPLTLEGLLPGESRKLTLKEIGALKSL